MSRTVVALAWLLKHPSGNPTPIRGATSATDVELTREEWYTLTVAARGAPMP
ncbi:MAG: hypothetical protein M9921_07980 [Fimbriimonadaceae bacterium]|nr:hypothetical protein [Chthonomonadaceae bacterium]MCO5296780.1 hypothetical protein [Fimbriimonadaceae bacterium]